MVLGIAVMAGLYWNSALTVKKVRFSGNYFVSAEELEMIEIPKGVNPDSMDFGKIMNQLEKIPYVKHADISVQPSGNLMIDITERHPVALLADGEKKIYVDPHGVRLPLVLGKTVDVPILYGFSATPISDTLRSKTFRATSDFLSAVQRRPACNATISEVVWAQNQGVVALTNQNGVKLIFGKGDFENRLQNWEAFYGRIVKQKGIESMRTIDLRFEGQIVTLEK